MGIGANPLGIATLVSTLMPLVTASVVERATNGGGPGLGASVPVEHDAKLDNGEGENQDEDRPAHRKAVVYLDQSKKATDSIERLWIGREVPLTPQFVGELS